MKKASFAGGVWMPSSTSGGTDTEVYFSLEKDTPFHLKRFDTEEEPKSILKVLQENGHPNFAQVSHVFQVKDGQYYYLAFKKHGVSLEDFLKSDVNKKRLSNKHLISSFYQKILVDLLRVWRHLVGLQVKCGLKLKNVYIYDGGDAPHVSLVDFSTGAAFCNQWDELVSLVEAINTNCSYAHGNGEMKSFLRIIKDGYKGGMENLSKNSLFWSLKQRKSLTCDLWDMVKNVPNMRLYKGEQIFSPDPSNWRQICYRDFRLKALVEHFDVLNKRNNVEFLSYPYDKETRSCWQVICKTFAHFESTNKQVSHNIRTNKQTKDLLQRGQRAFNSEKEFQLLVESSFPEYIPALRTIACTFESISGLNIVPKNDILNNLFTKRN